MLIFFIFLLLSSITREPFYLYVPLKTNEDNLGAQVNKLPGILEVFPELRLPWPKWLKNKNGERKSCKTDSDCPFPLACCYHPILPYEQYCCSGWNKRIMVPQYIYEFIK